MRFEKRGNRHGLEGYMLLLDLRKGGKCREENVFCVRIKLTPKEKFNEHASRRYLRRGYNLLNSSVTAELQVSFYVPMYV